MGAFIIITIIVIPFGDKETEAMRHSVICPNSHSIVVKLGYSPREFCFQSLNP